MPKIIFSDGRMQTVKYRVAAELNQFLDEPERLDKITDSEERAKKEEFLALVEYIDWTDVDKKKPIKQNTDQLMNKTEIRAVINDTSLHGKAKFHAIGNILKGKKS